MPMGIAPGDGGCMHQANRRRQAPSPAPTEDGQRLHRGTRGHDGGEIHRELSITKFLSTKAEELAKEDKDYKGADAEYVLNNYYVENVSEGSGLYDDNAMRAYAQLMPVKAEDVKWFNDQMSTSEPDFRAEVYGNIISDAMSAIGADPALALALTVARRSA